MNIEQLIHANVLLADLIVVDSNLTAMDVKNLAGILHLKAALVTLANIADLEPNWELMGASVARHASPVIYRENNHRGKYGY